MPLFSPVGINVEGGYNWELLGTAVVSGTPSVVSFTGINSKYRALKVVTSRLTKTLSSRAQLRLNNISTNSYSCGVIQLNGTTWATSGFDLDNHIRFFTAAADTAENFTILIEQTNLAGFKSITSKQNRQSLVAESFGTFESTSAITEINLDCAGSTWTSGTLYVYGSV